MQLWRGVLPQLWYSFFGRCLYLVNRKRLACPFWDMTAPIYSLDALVCVSNRSLNSGQASNTSLPITHLFCIKIIFDLSFHSYLKCNLFDRYVYPKKISLCQSYGQTVSFNDLFLILEVSVCIGCWILQVLLPVESCQYYLVDFIPLIVHLYCLHSMPLAAFSS